LTVKVGLKTVEFEKGKSGIIVGPLDRSESVLDTLIGAAKAGELDSFLDHALGSEKRPAVKTKKVA
jgi:hypothetical protein